MRLWMLVVVLLCGSVAAAYASSNSSREESRASNVDEAKRATVLVGMSEKQKEGFERTWEKTRPRWEAEEKAFRLEKSGSFYEAIEEYKKAVLRSEDDFYSETSHRALARLYEKTGQRDAAIKELEWLIGRFKKMNYPNKDLLREYEDARSRLLKQIAA